jgi:hypothetical protein
MSNRSTIEIIKESLNVDNGTVTFKCREGRGSGKAVQIPAEQFDEFVTLIKQTQENLKDKDNK